MRHPAQKAFNLLADASHRPFDAHSTTRLTTFADVLAALTNPAPIRLATRVEAAMDTGKGIIKVVDVNVTKMLCAARYVVPNWLVANVKISKANHSAITMIIPGNASLTIGPLLC